MAMPLDYTLPLSEIIQNYFLNVTLIAANECFKPLLNDYQVSTTPEGWVHISGTHDKSPLHLTLSLKSSNRPHYYCVGTVVTWDQEPDHAPFDMSLQCHIMERPIKYFDRIRNTLVAALEVKG